MRRWFFDGHRQTELARKQLAITQQWQPCVANNRFQLRSELQLALTTHMVESEQQVMTV